MADPHRRLVAGMRPNDAMHIGHYHGAVKHWVYLQHEYDCYFCVNDWQALAQAKEAHHAIAHNSQSMLINWLAAGIKPGSATLFLQSHVPELAELHVLLSMMGVAQWQALQEQQDDKPYHSLTSDLLVSTQMLAFRAGHVWRSDRSMLSVHLAQALAKSFNQYYGAEQDYERNVQSALMRLGKKVAGLYSSLRKEYVARGDQEALATAQVLVRDQQSIALADKERLLGYLEGGGKTVLHEPRVFNIDAPTLPGADGQRMTLAATNRILLRADEDSVHKVVRNMPTDPNRIHLADVGEPEACAVGQWHRVYQTQEGYAEVVTGCHAATLACSDCKKTLACFISEEQERLRQQAKPYLDDLGYLNTILADGAEKARDEVQETLRDVRAAMGLLRV